jgi:hypothetical protein
MLADDQLWRFTFIGLAANKHHWLEVTMRILASDVQMEALSRRSEIREVTREQLRTSNQSAGESAPAGLGTLVGISHDARVEYDQQYTQYSYRNSDVYSFNDLMRSGGLADPILSFTDTGFIEQTVSAVFKGQSAARFLVQPAGGSFQLNSSQSNAGSLPSVSDSVGSNGLASGGILFGTPVDAGDARTAQPINVSTRVGNLDQGNLTADSTIQVSGTGLMQLKQYTLSQVEQTQLFNGYGSVTTADGRVINFGLYMAMDRQERIETQSELLVQSRPMTDPLVINFGAETAQLKDTYFDFDIDADGVSEKIGTLGKGSGYLVFDRNGNGQVDDGSELFGPQSGRGFDELAQYDADGNLWIDEGDPIFDELQVWVTDEQGESSLRSLAEVGVGAIYLGSSSANFDLVSPDGIALGRVKANGIYLTESGEVRSVQEIDLANQAASESAEPEQMSSSEMASAVNKARLTADEDSESDQSDSERKPVIADMSMAIERLEQLREDQKAFGERFKDEEPRSVLSQLVEALEKTLAKNRDMLNENESAE